MDVLLNCYIAELPHQLTFPINYLTIYQYNNTIIP